MNSVRSRIVRARSEPLHIFERKTSATSLEMNSRPWIPKLTRMRVFVMLLLLSKQRRQ